MPVILGVLTVVVVGLMVGVELAVAVFVNPIFDRLPADGGPAARSDGARVLGRAMPFWYIGGLALAVVWAVLAWGAPATPLVLVAVGLLVLSVVMSVTLLVPINDRVAAWAADGTPSDWRAQVHRWDRWHHLRVAIIVAAFVLLVVAVA
ncbi:putative membrane protein [Actinomycetospora succinea]|uniref:Putative membrane protein n=1 Tax=Actinomycetospora succinea TaxID=663603 RepID=A0A4R6UN29_9PSEU|nr:DUF1772 domain-containing protein [Actinomycetospora succinea]TDQ46999.1 putative membrane protein [Actinomycetospora succinea]